MLVDTGLLNSQANQYRGWTRRPRRYSRPESMTDPLRGALDAKFFGHRKPWRVAAYLPDSANHHVASFHLTVCGRVS